MEWSDEELLEIVDACIKDGTQVSTAIASTIIAEYVRWLSINVASHNMGLDKPVGLGKNACALIGVEITNNISRAIDMYLTKLPAGEVSTEDAHILAFVETTPSELLLALKAQAERN